MRKILFILAAALIASQAAAQGVTTKDDKDLTTLGQKIDKASSSGDSGRVTSKIVDQWKGTQFRFDPSSPPRELTAQDVQNLRQKKLGYGEISILLALTAKQPNATTAKSLNEILAMHQADGGWGNVAKELGYSNLGSVMKSVKATETSLEKVAVSGRAEKVEKVNKLDKPVKPERVERVDKPGR